MRPTPQNGTCTPMTAARIRLGLTQEKAADLVGVSVSTWSRWENGKLKIAAKHRRPVADLLSVTLKELDQWMDSEATPVSLDQQVWSLDAAATVEEAAALWRLDVDPARRRVLASLPWTPAVLSEWLASWAYDPEPPSRDYKGTGPDVGMEDVHRVRDAIEMFVLMDHQYGGGLTRPSVVNYLDTESLRC